MKKQGKKRTVGMIAGILLLLLIAAGAALLVWKPDWRFLLKEQVASWFRNADWEEREFGASDLICGSFSEIEGAVDMQKNDALYLVNVNHPIPSGREFDLVCYKDTDVQMNACITKAYSDLSEKVMEVTGEKLYVRSSYRDREAQAVVLQENPDTATKPGASEHETGLALDVYVSQYGGYGFLKSEAGQYVNRYCYEQGFVIRYPWGKSGSTGVVHEPWHIRYVGLPHAELMYMRNQTLEEYLDSLEIGTFYQVGDQLITRQRADGEIRLPKEGKSWSVSEDGLGNLIFTGSYR
ncbi:M15 family metallopeptidase [Hominifimenecus sp. rT4P-3]|uniref:M15 family metallopeptidase n=1 Tax=Hominifimenecus sp. rT4P-3 TaxID=3242979 RepID=UPI003DA5C7DE